MRPKRLISLLVAVCMMITMLPLSAVTAFAADTASSTEQEISVGDYKYAYTVNAGGSTATITEFRGPVDPKNTGPYDIDIPEKLGNYTVTVLGEDSFSTDDFDSPLYDIHHTKIQSVTIPQCVTSIGEAAFAQCRALQSLTIDDAAISIGDWAFDECLKLTTLSLGKKITTIGDYAFDDCRILNNVTIPQSVTSIGKQAFGRCYGMDSFTIEDAATSIGEYAFWDCQKLETLSLGKNITTIGDDAFRSCYKLETIMLPAGLTSFGNCLIGCPAGRKWDYHGNPINPIGAIYYNNDWDHAKELPGYNVLKNRNFLYLCKVTFDAKGGSLTGYDEVPVYKTEKITDTKANELTAINDPTRAGYKFTGWYTEDGQPFDVNDTAITEDITLYAGWKFDPNAPGCHPLTVTGGTVTVKYDGSDVTSKLNSKTDAATGQKTYSVPDGATVTVTLDKTAVPNGKVFDGWSTGEFSLPTGQDYKAESITFSMSNDVNVSAKYRDAATDHTTVTIEGLENAVIKEGESKDFTVKVTPNDDAKLGEAFIDFGDKNSEIKYKDQNGEYKLMPENGLKINLGDGEVEREFRITPKETGKQTLTAVVKQDKNELATDEKDFVVSEMPILTLKDGVITSVTVPGKDGADPEDITEIVKKNANEDGSFNVPEGATVSVAFDKDAFADSGLKFGHWDITGLDDPNAYQNKESFAFVMPAKAVTLKAMTQDASIEDDEPDIVGPIVIGTTVVVGGAVLGYQAYSLGAEFAGKLMALPYFPSNRSALAMMLWEDAGKPMPESELLYPDVGQEERDMDLQHAARWAMENELIPDLNDEGTAPEEMKFYPDNTVSKIDVLKAWQKAQELKQNA
ncbi:leucine-rich repeat protein [Faecalibacterium prausnitzii]|uniref:leucine-rich repeat protein n=1 Tax=Faecalibacterium prausnitzii TaxID=853 RepID=UPI0012DC5D90|nr:leucine-rich repeat protein [Faecalibacterium prausnitzii]